MGSRARRLARLVEPLRDGEGRIGLIEGPAGIGKGRLLAELKRQPADPGMRVLSSRAEQHEHGLPLG